MYHKTTPEYSTEVFPEINPDKKPNYRLFFLIFAIVIASLVYYIVTLPNGKTKLSPDPSSKTRQCNWQSNKAKTQKRKL